MALSPAQVDEIVYAILQTAPFQWIRHRMAQAQQPMADPLEVRPVEPRGMFPLRPMVGSPADPAVAATDAADRAAVDRVLAYCRAHRVGWDAGALACGYSPRRA